MRQLGASVFRQTAAVSSDATVFSTPIGPVQAPRALCEALAGRLAAGAASFEELAQLPETAGQTEHVFQTLQLMLMQDRAHPGNPAADAGADHADALTHWFERQGIALRTLPLCGTALRTKAASPKS